MAIGFGRAKSSALAGNAAAAQAQQRCAESPGSAHLHCCVSNTHLCAHLPFSCFSPLPCLCACSGTAKRLKEAEKERRSLVTADLRGPDYLPPELLSQLPPPSQAESLPDTAAAASESKRDKKRRARAEFEEDEWRDAHDGLPKVVNSSANVRVAILEGRGGAPRTQAPARAELRAFMEQQLYGKRHKRGSAVTHASLKAKGNGRFGPAANFATVPLAPKPERKKGKKAAAAAGGGAGGFAGGRASTLEQMAARIMRKKG